MCFPTSSPTCPIPCRPRSLRCWTRSRHSTSARYQSPLLAFVAGTLTEGRSPCLLAQVRTLKPDVIHAWMYHCNLLTACTLSTSIIWSIHNTTLPSGQTRLLTRTVDRLSAVLSPVVPARIVYCAEKARQEHEARGYMVSKGIVIRNGVDVACFPPNERLRAANGRSSGFVL